MVKSRYNGVSNLSQLTPMMNQYIEIKNQHKDKLLFFRLGDFYELFFEDAIIASRELEITLTGRDCGMEERAPMCGVPYHAVNAYISKLIEKNFKVAICEQIEDPALSKGLVKRDVTKIITPGTITDSMMLDEKQNNYLLSLYFSEKVISLSHVDLSTGEFNCTYLYGNEMNTVIEEVYRINPAEIISNKEFPDILASFDTFNILNSNYYDSDECKRQIKNQFHASELEGLGFENEQMIKACGALLLYLNETQRASLNHINLVKLYNISNFMKIDINTRKNLELCESIRDKTKKGTLISVLDKTSTAMGGRKLRQWIEKPLLNVNDINNRLDSVQEFFSNYVKREEIKEYLKTIYDLERLTARISLNTANARDLISFKNSIELLPHIKTLTSDCSSIILKDIAENLDDLQDLYELLSKSIQEDPPFSLREGNLIKDNYTEEIDHYKEASKNGKQWISDLEQKERGKTGIKNLKIGFNKVFGYYIDITKSNISSVPDYFIRKQTLSNSERYITPELKELENTVLGAEEKLIELEYQTFITIRSNIAKHVIRIQKTSSLISELDCICSFAEVSQKNDYAKPFVNNTKKISIKDGRHPVVEAQNNDNVFVPNDTELDNEENRMLIITGPNMAGKSTYMRQVALITLMTQIGCFVPVKSASIGIVDRIFTRVGAADDLASGRSTFMVEMSELANIISNATENSLIILDEIGRGTSTFDGLSIAWSVVENISDKNKIGAKTLFATHYHELTELENKIDGVKNYCISIEDKGKNIIFLRKIIRGGANGSYGIQVARLAGIPEDILERAAEILSVLERSEKSNHTNVYTKRKKNKTVESVDGELSLFNYPSFSLIEDLKKIDINNMTPIQALNTIIELNEKAKNI